MDGFCRENPALDIRMKTGGSPWWLRKPPYICFLNSIMSCVRPFLGEIHVWITLAHFFSMTYPPSTCPRLKYPRCSTFFCMVIFQVFRAFLFCASARRKCVVECWKSTPSFRTTDAWLRPRRASQSPSLISWAPRKQKDYGGHRKSAGTLQGNRETEHFVEKADLFRSQNSSVSRRLPVFSVPSPIGIELWWPLGGPWGFILVPFNNPLGHPGKPWPLVIKNWGHMSLCSCS